jgi:hypothetical protein
MQKIIDMFLTKEAFDQYVIRLREEQAHKYDMTLEQWDAAVLAGATVSPITPHNSNTQPSSSLNS